MSDTILASFVEDLAAEMHTGQQVVLLHKLTAVANEVSAATRLVCRLSDKGPPTTT